MRTVAVLLVCLACAGHGRRIDLSARQPESRPPDSLRNLAELLLASSRNSETAAAFLAPGVTGRSHFRQSSPLRRTRGDEAVGPHYTDISKAASGYKTQVSEELIQKNPSTRRLAPVMQEQEASGFSVDDLDSFVVDAGSDPTSIMSITGVDNLTDIDQDIPEDLLPDKQAAKVAYGNEETGLLLIEADEVPTVETGNTINFENGATGLVIELYPRMSPPHISAVFTNGTFPAIGDGARIVRKNVTAIGWNGDDAYWSGLYDWFGRPVGETPEPTGRERKVEIFEGVVPILGRKPLSESLLTGIVAIDAILPISRGQSMMVLGSDDLPEGSKRSDVSTSIVAGQVLEGGMPTILVLTQPDKGKQDKILASVKEADALDNTRVIQASTTREAVLAIQLGCSIAQARGGDDILVVVDDMQPVIDFWGAIETGFEALGKGFGDLKKDSERGFFARFVERAHRRKVQINATQGTTGGSVSLIMNVPSMSKIAPKEKRKASYKLQDFIDDNFPDSMIDRIEILEEKGIEITDKILMKLGLNAPGSDHLGSGQGFTWSTTVDQFTSLVDGHLDLRQRLAEEGIVPPLDPGTSLQRSAVGTGGTRSWGQDKALQEFNKGLRLRMCQALDKFNTDDEDPIMEAKFRGAQGFRAVFHQPSLKPMPLGEVLVLLFAAHNKFFDEKIQAEGEAAVRDAVPHVLEYVKSQAGDMVSNATKTGLLDQSTRERWTTLIKEALASAP